MSQRLVIATLVSEKKLKKLIQGGSGAFGNAATRIETFAAADINGLFREQATELDRKRREAALHRNQPLVHEKATFAPIWQLAPTSGVRPRVEELDRTRPRSPEDRAASS